MAGLGDFNGKDNQYFSSFTLPSDQNQVRADYQKAANDFYSCQAKIGVFTIVIIVVMGSEVMKYE